MGKYDFKRIFRGNYYRKCWEIGLGKRYFGFQEDNDPTQSAEIAF